MFSIYVTNKSGVDVYIRLQHEKLSAVNTRFHLEFDQPKGDKAKDTKDDVNSYLVRWGFCMISPQQTVPFPIDVANDGPRKYASLYAKSKLWIMDYEMNCMRYGCLFVTSPITYTHKITFHLNQANPEPIWIAAKKGDVLSQRVAFVNVDTRAYFGRSLKRGGAPCKVKCTTNGRRTKTFDVWIATDGSLLDSGDILCDTGHELVRAKTGDLVPPHAVITGTSEPEGSLYLGRVGGNTPCSISTEGGRIKSFCYDSKKFQSGEILVLINGR